MTNASAPTPGEAEAAKPTKPWFKIRKRSESRPTTRRFTAFFLTLFVMLTGAVGVAVPAGADSPADGIVFDGSPGTGASPATLGGYTMTPFGPDGATPFGVVKSVPAPGGKALKFDQDMGVRDVSDLTGGWDKGGYAGRAYRSGFTMVTLTLPTGTRAFHFHAESTVCGSSSVKATATADGGTTTSGWIANPNICREPSATYMGFYATGSESLKSITVTTTASFGGVLVGDFGIAYAPEGQVVVEKAVANWGGDPAAAGSFGYTVTDSTAATVVTDSVTPGTDKSHDLTAGTYTLAESATTGWSSAVSCTDPDGVETTGGEFSIVPGQTTTCTITNTAQDGQVVVKKAVANWGGDPAAAGSFGYTVTDSTAATVVTDSVTPGTDKSHELAPGTYTLAETATTGWSSAVSCTNPGGEPTTGGGFSIVPGQTTTCTITNTAQPATVTVTGVVTAGPSRLSVRLPICELYAFQVTVDGTAQRAIPFQTDRKTGKCKPSAPITLQPGASFKVTQAPTLGSLMSRQSYSAGCGGTAGAGGSYACTITNTLGASHK